MTFLPIVDRELRVQARQQRTSWMRFFAAVAALTIWIFLSTAHGRFLTSIQQVRYVFTGISLLGLAIALFAGMFLTAECICEEKREGTLGLLFLTDLKGTDVILGKLVSTSISAVYGLLAIFPILALPMLTGGVSPGEFWRILLVLVATIYWSLCTGMFVSTTVSPARSGIWATLMVIAVMTGLLPLLYFCINSVHRMPGVEVLLAPSPVFSYIGARDDHYSGYHGALEFWGFVSTIAVIGTALLVWTCVLLPRSWQTSERATVQRPWFPRLRIGSKAAASSASLPWWWLESDPAFWLATRGRRRWNFLVALLVALPLVFCALTDLFKNGRGNSISMVVAVYGAYGLHFLIKCLVASEVSRRLSEERRSGALELLLATDVTPREIISAQIRAGWRTMAPMLAVAAALNFFLFVRMVLLRSGDFEEKFVFACVFLGGIGVLFLDTHAMLQTGVWNALNKKPNRAVLSTILQVMVPGWVGVFFFMFLGMAGAFSGGNTIYVVILIWFAGVIIVDCVVVANASLHLKWYFRQAATGDLPAFNLQAPPAPMPNLGLANS